MSFSVDGGTAVSLSPASPAVTRQQRPPLKTREPMLTRRVMVQVHALFMISLTIFRDGKVRNIILLKQKYFLYFHLFSNSSIYTIFYIIKFITIDFWRLIRNFIRLGNPHSIPILKSFVVKNKLLHDLILLRSFYFLRRSTFLYGLCRKVRTRM